MSRLRHSTPRRDAFAMGQVLGCEQDADRVGRFRVQHMLVAAGRTLHLFALEIQDIVEKPLRSGGS